MFKKYLLLSAAILGLGSAAAATAASAENAPIVGNVQSKCTVQTVKQGVYAQPSPGTLTTSPTDGGVLPRIRYDVALADYYIAKISWPQSFSSSPALSDAVTWDGDAEVDQVTDAGMSAYETNKVQYNNVTEFDLTIAGTVWFKVSSEATYGYDKSFPGGNYTAIVTAECIAK